MEYGSTYSWKNIFKDEAIWCPLCRHEASSDAWFTIEQIEYAKSEAFEVVKGKIHNSLLSGARKFNQGQSKHKFISMSMKVKGGKKREYAIPIKSAESMQLKIKCEVCNSRFAVIGSALFCPACGHNSVTQMYADSLRKIKAKRDNIEIVRDALIEAATKDEAELTCRSLKESCILDGVVAFQKYCEGLYLKYGTPPFNAFQRLKQGNALWKEKIQKGYDFWLQPDEILSLNILFQKRHILSHNEGIVDSKYIDNSGDNSYKVGQRIVVLDKDIDNLLSYLEKLGEGLVQSIE